VANGDECRARSPRQKCGVKNGDGYAAQPMDRDHPPSLPWLSFGAQSADSPMGNCCSLIRHLPSYLFARAQVIVYVTSWMSWARRRDPYRSSGSVPSNLGPGSRQQSGHQLHHKRRRSRRHLVGDLELAVPGLTPTLAPADSNQLGDGSPRRCSRELEEWVIAEVAISLLTEKPGSGDSTVLSGGTALATSTSSPLPKSGPLAVICRRGSGERRCSVYRYWISDHVFGQVTLEFQLQSTQI
jgi:hypothetical protein